MKKGTKIAIGVTVGVVLTIAGALVYAMHEFACTEEMEDIDFDDGDYKCQTGDCGKCTCERKTELDKVYKDAVDAIHTKNEDAIYEDDADEA